MTSAKYFADGSAAGPIQSFSTEESFSIQAYQERYNFRRFAGVWNGLLEITPKENLPSGAIASFEQLMAAPAKGFDEELSVDEVLKPKLALGYVCPWELAGKTALVKDFVNDKLMDWVVNSGEASDWGGGFKVHKFNSRGNMNYLQVFINDTGRTMNLTQTQKMTGMFVVYPYIEAQRADNQNTYDATTSIDNGERCVRWVCALSGDHSIAENFSFSTAPAPSQTRYSRARA